MRVSICTAFVGVTKRTIVRENNMRVTIFSLLAIASLAATDTYAQPGRNTPDQVSACQELRGATKGLYGLCVSFCSTQDQTGIDMNDIDSVRAAAPSIALLEKYNERKTHEDPEMPCFANDDDGPDNDGGDSPPVDTSCACWSAQELLEIDGVLDPVRGLTPTAQCTANQTTDGVTVEAQVYEGYTSSTGGDPVVVSSAFAYVSPDETSGIQGCMFESPTSGIRNLPLPQRIDAEQCIQSIISHCDAVGIP